MVLINGNYSLEVSTSSTSHLDVSISYTQNTDPFSSSTSLSITTIGNNKILKSDIFDNVIDITSLIIINNGGSSNIIKVNKFDKYVRTAESATYTLTPGDFIQYNVEGNGWEDSMGGGGSVSLPELTDGTQLTQIVDNSGNKVTVTGNKLDVNASISTLGLATDTLQTLGNASLSAIASKDFATQTTLSTLNTKIPSNLTVTSTRLLVDGSGVTQPVSGTFWQVTQPVSGIVTVTGALTDTQLRATPVPISGTVTANIGTTNGLALNSTLSGIDFATQTTLALIKAKTDNIDVAISTRTKPSDTQIVSLASTTITGTVACTQSGTWNINNIAGTISLPTGASTESTLSTLNTKIPSSLTVTSTRLLVDGSGVTQPVSLSTIAVTNIGTFATQATLSAETTKVIGVIRTSDGSGNLVTSTSNALDVNLKTSSITLPVSGTFFQATQPVSLTSTTITGTVSCTQSGTWNIGSITTLPSLVAGSALIGKVGIDQTTPGTTNKVTLGSDVVHTIVDSGTVTAVTAITNALPAGSNVIGHIIADTGSTTAVTGNVTIVQPTGTNLHIVTDSGTISTITNVVHVDDNAGSLTIDNANLDVAISTRLKPADTLAAVTTVGTITNVVHIDDNSSSITVDNNGTFVTQNTETRPATSAITSVAGSASNVTLLSSNANRRGAMIYNDSTAILYLKLGATATTSSFTVKMQSEEYYEVPTPVYSGIIDGIWSSAAGNARITEIT